MRMSPEERDLERFLRGDIAAADLPHREHVRMAFQILRRHDYLESAQRYSDALRLIAGRAGHPQAFNLTITIAFLALIAERMAGHEAEDFAGFAARNPELLEKGLLGRWYGPGRLGSPLARATFLLPDPCR
jgi:hypothetical protein